MPLVPAPSAEASAPPSRVVGRYLMYDEIASGGMASVHYGRLLGTVGFSRTVAIKHLHPHFSTDADFVSMFLDEARLVARIQHPNVATPLDVVVLEDSKEIFLVMEYIHGENLSQLIGNARKVKLTMPLPVGAAIVCNALRGLHAAHEAIDDRGQPLHVVHRDISPQNIMVGVDGVARVLDFGVAKATLRCQSTQQSQLKGKLSYMAPEQLRSGPVDRRADVFAAGIVLWETLTQEPLFRPTDAASALALILSSPIRRPKEVNPSVPASLDEVVMRALDRDPELRFRTAREFADAVEEASAIASNRKVGEWVERLCGPGLSKRATRVSEIERSTSEVSLPEDLQRLLSSKRSTGPVAAPGAAGVSNAPAGPSSAVPSTADCLSNLAPAPGVEPSRTRKARWLVAGVSALSLLLFAATVIGLRSRTAPGAKSERTSRLDVTAVPAHPPVMLDSPAPPSSLAAVRSPAPLRASANQTASPGAAVARKRANSRSEKAMKGSRPNDPKNCTPPYVIDAQGIRRIKPQCL
jgi:eukaryotic-like serine/threonine-protein kinase